MQHMQRSCSYNFNCCDAALTLFVRGVYVLDTSVRVQAERALAGCGGVHLHWGALKLGWYLPGSALVTGSAAVVKEGGEGRRHQGRRPDGRYGGEGRAEEGREYFPSSDVEQFVREMDQDEGDGDAGGVDE